MDLHIHTCLSPCGDSKMIPETVLSHAKMHGLQIIGISDHNSAENVAAFKEAGERIGFPVIGGIEVTMLEEIHVLGFFDELENLLQLQDLVYNHLQGENDGEAFGEQYVVDADGFVARSCRKLLIGATDLSLEKVLDSIHQLDGIARASHIDRASFSVLSQLGFIPEGIYFDALEFSPQAQTDTAEYKNPGIPLVRFSDSHYPQDIGRSFSVLSLGEPCVAEIRRALRERRDCKGDGGYLFTYT